MINKLVFTCGDINGIGPEIAIKTINKICSRKSNNSYVLIIPKNIFISTSQIIEPKFDFQFFSDVKSVNSSKSIVTILTTESVKQSYGHPTAESGRAAFKALKISFDLLKNSQTDAVITAPVSKTALSIAGIKYPGQTEMFADWCGVKNFVMTFLSKKLRVALYSIHIPLKDVPKSLNRKEFRSKLDIIHNMLKTDLGIPFPKIAILGLNPHAGENGIIGKEEKEILEPLFENESKISFAEGPFSPDAFFASKRFKDFDLVFGLYHDQVLIPFKYINSGKGVNFSAGLPIIRTSPDHGVAYDIAGKGIADESSMVEAFYYAKIILKNRSATRLNK